MILYFYFPVFLCFFPFVATEKPKNNTKKLECSKHCAIKFFFILSTAIVACCVWSFAAFLQVKNIPKFVENCEKFIGKSESHKVHSSEADKVFFS